jgi:hypothetical protein
MRGHLAPARPRSTVLGHFLSLAARRLRSRSTCLKLEFWRRALRLMGVFWSHARPANRCRNSSRPTEATGLCRSSSEPVVQQNSPRLDEGSDRLLRALPQVSRQRLGIESEQFGHFAESKRLRCIFLQGFAVAAVSRPKERGDPWRRRRQRPSRRQPDNALSGITLIQFNTNR